MAKIQAVRPLDLPAVSTRTLVIAAAVVAGLLLMAYLVAFDQGALSRSGMFLHELMHDGRHLLGVPCH
ncbi:CbtB domain-containing protein [Actinoplanes sp. RD1]|uniref:CbtB domain-containing protein n=1 Tax=Actinoplanes sp. RD1 TaxID=3064538 RepID=UPI0027419700|nr:CbtB domain-containing protein [Actinoplanes sp. RD1]